MTEGTLIILVLVTGEKVIGVIKKKYTDDEGYLLEGTKVILEDPISGGLFLHPYLFYAETQEYWFAGHSIVTTAMPVPVIKDFYTKQNDNPDPDTKEKVVVKGTVSTSVH